MNRKARQLLQWYDTHHRLLPWRIAPAQRLAGEVADPYRVWLSEIMLQQTTVEAVKAYFRTFVARWPTVRALAAASDDEVMRAWAGLGYYSRARNLKKCAEIITGEMDGEFPSTFEGLKALPGIGDYTAAAIAAIAFDRPAAVVDGNVERVVTRLFAITTPLPAAKAEIRATMQAITPEIRPGDFAQGMMDLGATICTPRRPACTLCPVNDGCKGLQGGYPEVFPVKAPKKKRPVRLGAAFVAISPGGSVYLRKRPASGLLGGMAEVPCTGWTARVDGDTSANAAPFPAQWSDSGSISHVFTHFELRLTVYRADDIPEQAIGAGWWSVPDELPREALPTVMKKAIAAAIPDAFKGRQIA
ncbi:A/G-specific adenine glycosylase [Phyllobacterium leguminum]|uniref:Adenine DNA glycosylase n=1 Tax=Phyllobacterium leguminum TaxID=314237 RepID=A0A318SYA9_9HYPH|nr:A/G-specific adenine glycosylase [Phyllobacterium leguminum]PYE85336.1 A/G-specific DNA-adenine glycosylase [Phyllobacterium leguminum]